MLKVLLLLSVIVAVQCRPRAAHLHECIHDKEMKGVQGSYLHNLQMAPESNTKRQTGRGAPLRVHINFDALSSDPGLCSSVGQTVTVSGQNFVCQQEDILTAEKNSFLQTKIFPDAKAFFERSLNVTRLTSNLVTGASCGCSSGGVTIGAPYTTTGIANTDLIIFLTARSTRLSNNTIAFACPCQFIAGNGRSVVGYINWGPNKIDTDPISYPEQLGVAIHELTHVLGFTSAKYNEFPGGNPVGSAVVTSAGGATHPVTTINSTKVVQMARTHYNCPTLTGLELEDGGSSGTAGSHWERRLIYNEYMAGFSSYDPVYSYFTMALLEDSGWYFPDYTQATPLAFGLNEGCPFVTTRCDSRSRPYSCDPIKQSGDEACTHDFLRKGKCNIRTYSSVPVPFDTFFNYFGNPLVRGNDPLADYCGFIRYDKNYRGDCTIPAIAGSDQFAIDNEGEVFGASSRCLSAVDESGAKGPSCHNMTCVMGQPKIQIGDGWYDCKYGAQIINPAGAKGQRAYICPNPPNRFCSDVPNYNSPWPVFDSISPNVGVLGDVVTITASGLSTGALIIGLGPEHGCIQSKVQVIQNGNSSIISCTIGAKPDAVSLRGENVVDVVVTDSQGRAAMGYGSFTLNGAGALFAGLWALILVIMWAL